MIRKVSQMPSSPSAWQVRDWRQVAKDYDRLVFSQDATEDFFPLLWWDDENINHSGRMFGLPSYVGGIKSGGKHEAINCAAAVLSATLVGIDKRHQHGTNWVAMLQGYYDPGQHLFLNQTFRPENPSFWYDLYPHILLYALTWLYPEESNLASMMEATANRWLQALEGLRMPNGQLDFTYTAYDFTRDQGVHNGRWAEPDAAAGIAWMMAMAYAHTQASAYREAALSALHALANNPANPLYELLLPFGAYTAARMNAEADQTFDVAALLNWCFDGDSEVRPGWGVIAERWGDYDCYGLVGSTTDWGQRWDHMDTNASSEVLPNSGYAFAANTFAYAFPLVPLVRYDPQFAHDIGKWMTHAIVSARLFYPGSWSPQQQSCAFFRSDPYDVIAYEGLRKLWDHQSPYATGDPIRYSWGSIDLGLYGSSHVGIFGGIVQSTAVDGLVLFDLLATDVFHGPACPTFLAYNPHPTGQALPLDVGLQPTVIYDAVTHRVLAQGQGMVSIPIAPDQAAVLVLVPATEPITTRSGKRWAGDTVIDFHIGT